MADEVDILALAAEDAAQPPPDPTEGLGAISEVALRLRLRQKRLEAGERVCKQIKDEIELILTKELPQIMRRYKMPKFELDDGTEISVQAVTAAHISEENRAAAHQWLRDNGFEDIIKTNVNLSFGKGEAETVATLTKKLEELGYSFTNQDAVNYQTLQAFVREQVKAGKSPPVDIFGIFSGDKAKVEKKKGAKN